MRTNALDEEMQAYFTQLNIAEKKSVIQLIKTFLKRDDSATRISLEQYNKEIDETLIDVGAGKTLTHEEVLKMAKNW